MGHREGELTGKVAIVTGSASGIGRTTAAHLAAAGATVVLADLPGTSLEEAAAEASVAGRPVLHHVVDISDEDAVSALIDYTVKEAGKLDILVNNAARQGLVEDTVVTDMDAAIWDSVFAVNARGGMLMCKHAIGPIIENGGGSIVNITSDTIFAGDFFATAYACSKAAVATLTKYVATQYAGKVRCNAIAPGLIRTPALAAGMPEPLQDVFIGHKLAGRLGDPLDVAEAVLFLGSDRSSFITGQVLRVDGGLLAHLPTTVEELRLMAQAG